MVPLHVRGHRFILGEWMRALLSNRTACGMARSSDREVDIVDEFVPAEIIEFDTMDEMDTLLSPFRLRLLSCFREPVTATQAADELDVKVTRLYRHLHRLVDQGFLVTVAERRKAKTVEKVYSIAARTFRPSQRFRDAHGGEGRAEMLRLAFRLVEAEVVEVAQADPGLDTEGATSEVSYSRLQLEEDDLAELVERARSLLGEYIGRQGPIAVSYFSSIVPLDALSREGTDRQSAVGSR